MNPEVPEEPKPRPPSKPPPKPFIPDENDVSDTWGWVSAKQFHNYFHEGFYAPFILNPDYMLIIDARSEEDFAEAHIVTSQWHGHCPSLQDRDANLNRYSIIILCDQDGSADENSVVRRIQHYMMKKNSGLEPMIVRGGMEVVEKQFPYMLTGQRIRAEDRPAFIPWYPAIILDFSLYIGRTEHALNQKVMKTLSITHVVNLSPKTPGVFPFINYLCIPIEDSDEIDLRSYFIQVNEQISKAIDSGGKVLVHCDEGLDPSATIIIAFLMRTRRCSLADAHDYVKSLRPIIQPSTPFLVQLSEYEEELYGRKYTNLEDLWI